MTWLFFIIFTLHMLTITPKNQTTVNTENNLQKFHTQELYIDLTGYSSRECETDDSPFITATGDSVEIGIIALSPDLIKIVGYNAQVRIEGFDRIFVVKDTMNEKFTNRGDIWFPKTSWAKQFGFKKNVKLTILILTKHNQDELCLRDLESPIK